MIRNQHRVEHVAEVRIAAHVLFEAAQVALQQSKPGAVVTLRARKRQPVVRVGGQNHAEVIRLFIVVARARRGHRSRADLRQQMVMIVIG